MTDDRNAIEAALDELLMMWHEWASAYSPVRGYPKQSPTRRMHTISNQYADANGALDAQIDDVVAEGIDAQVQAMADPHRTAIHCNARTLATGYAVWSSPRLPTDRVARAIIVVEARAMLIKRLQVADLM